MDFKFSTRRRKVRVNDHAGVVILSEALQVLQCCSVLQLGASLQDDDPVLTSVIGVKLQPKVPGGSQPTGARH